MLTRLDQLLNWGWNSEHHSAIQMRRVRTLSVSAWLLLLVGVPFVMRAIEWQIAPRLVTVPGAMLLAAASLVCLRVWQTRLGFVISAHLVIVSLYVAALGAIVTGGGVGSVTQGWLMVVPLLAGIALGPGGAVAWGLIALLSLAILAGLESAGADFSDQTPLPFQHTQHVMQAMAMAIALFTMIYNFLTQLSQSEQNLEDQNLKLQQQIIETAKAEQDARMAERAKTRFLANMSHEMRTPLNAVLGFTRRLIKSAAPNLNEREQQALFSIANSGSSMLRLVEDLFDLSALDSGDLRLQNSPLDAGHLLAGQMQALQPMAQLFGLRIRLEPAAAQMIVADACRLEQVLQNLIRHSIKRAEAGDIVLSVAMHSPQTVCLSVTDSAPAHSAEDARRLFDRFDHIHSSHERDTGVSGLGMALSRELIELQGGQLELVTLAQGNQFRILLPQKLKP